MPRAVNEGDPVVSLYPRSKVARDLRNVAKLVVDGPVDGVPEEDAKQRRWFK